MGKGEGSILQIRTLGRFEILVDGVPIPEKRWPRQKTKELLKVLLTAPGRPFTFDQLADALLPGANVETATHNIQARTSELRRVLEPGLSRGRDSKFIISSGEGYAFAQVYECTVDAQEFEARIRESERLESDRLWQKAAEAFEEALLLYGGEFLAEDRYAEWAESMRSRLRERYLQSLGCLASCYAELGRLRQAISCCQRVLGIDPCRESVTRRLMEYQDAAGQRSQALESFEIAERALHERLGVSPSAATIALRDRLASAKPYAALDPRRIAVLPLQDYSPDSNDAYFADGMTEELIGCLAQVKDFRVVARTSVMRFKDASKPIRQIARELGAGTILEGSVRKTGVKLRVSAQLIDAATEDHIWAEHFDVKLDDILEMQGDIARRTADALKLKLLASEGVALRSAEATTPKAHIAYMKGRHFLQKWKRDDIDRAVAYFEETLQHDPLHARAMSGLADAHCQLVKYTCSTEQFPKARAYAEQALALDDNLAEAYCALAKIACGCDRDFQEAEDLLRRAIDIDPNCAIAYARLADLLAATDRTAEAIETSKAALLLDPLSAPLNLLYSSCLYRAARFHEAIEYAEKAIELDPEMDDAWWELWYSLASTWDWDRAESTLRNIMARYPHNPHGYAYLAMCVQCRGRLREGVSLMEEALSLPGAASEPTVIFYCGNGYYFAREFAEAERYYRIVLERMPYHEGARILLAKCLIHQARFPEALAELDAAEETYGLSGDYWHSHAQMERGRIHVLLGEPEKAEALLAQLMEGETRQNRRFAISVLLHLLGRTDEALDWAEAAVDAREPHVNAFRKAPEFPEEMTRHPRFQALLKRIGLEE